MYNLREFLIVNKDIIPTNKLKRAMMLCFVILCLSFSIVLDCAHCDETGEQFTSRYAGASVQINNDLFNGAAVSTVPIAIPPGRAGMTPTVALTYNSNNKNNGPVGYGWSLGISSIQRATKKGVDYDPDLTDDVVDFVAGGVELVRKSDWDTTDGALGYCSKIEGTFTKYLYYQNETDRSLEYWVVQTADGKELYFGENTNTNGGSIESKLYFGDKNGDDYKVFKWCLNKVEDSNGNYFEYNYIIDDSIAIDERDCEDYFDDTDGELLALLLVDPFGYGAVENRQIYIDQINYTGNSVSSHSPKYSINFHYDEFSNTNGRSDTTISFIAKEAIWTKWLLNSISIEYDSQLVAAYGLNYESHSETTGQKQLSKVLQFDSTVLVDNVVSGTANTDKALNPVVLDYFGEQTIFQNEVRGERTISNNGYKYMADINSDGKSDLIVFKDPGDYILVVNEDGDYVFVPNPNAGYRYIKFYLSAKTETGYKFEENELYPDILIDKEHIDKERVSIQFGDVNGDGKLDLVGNLSTENSFRVYVNNNGFDGNYSEYSRETEVDSSGKFWYLADIDGDGKADYVYISDNDKKPYVKYGAVGGFEDAEFVCVSNNYISTYTYSEESDDVRDLKVQSVHFLDLNSDGMSDFVRVAKIQHTSQIPSLMPTLYKHKFIVQLSRGRNGTTPVFSDISQADVDEKYTNFCISRLLKNYNFYDVNGDSKPDLVYISGDKIYVRTGTGNNQYEVHDEIVVEAPEICGDDIESQYIKSNLLPFAQPVVWGEIDDDYFSWMYFGDINGDGKIDMMYNEGTVECNFAGYSCYESYTDKVVVLFSDGNTFIENESFNRNNNYHVRFQFLSDVTGDGKADYIYFSTDETYCDIDEGCSFRYYICPTSPEKTMALKSITNSLGGATEIAYTPSTNFDNIYLPFVSQTVTSVTVKNGLGQSLSTDFSYQGGYYDVIQKEFRGFKEVTQVNPITTVQSVYLQDEYKKGRISNTTTYKTEAEIETKIENETAIKLSEVESIWSDSAYIDNTGNKSRLVRLGNQISRLFQNDNENPYQETEETYEFVDDDHPGIENISSYTTEVTTKNLSDEDDPVIIKTTTLSNQSLEDGWIWRTIEETLNDTLRKTTCSYNDNGNLLSKTVLKTSVTTIDPETDKTTTTETTITIPSDGDGNPLEYTYDNYGNLENNYDAKGNLTKTEYDDETHTYPISITYPSTHSLNRDTLEINSEGDGIAHSVTRTYDPKFGKIKTSTDENGHTTTYHYDDFGRLIRIEFGSKILKCTTYNDCVYQYTSSGDTEITTPAHVIDITQIDSGEMLPSRVYIDGMGRKVQTVSQGMKAENSESQNSTSISTLTQIATKYRYDNLGRLDIETGPIPVSGFTYIQDDGFDWTGYPYVKKIFDELGRPEYLITKHDSVELESRIKYDKHSTTYTSTYEKSEDNDDENTEIEVDLKTVTKDYLGRVVHVVEHNKADSYSNSEYLQFNISEDYHTFYDYNAVGDLVHVWSCSTNDTKNSDNCIETIIHYNSLGQKISMSDPDMGYWIYEYDDNGNLEIQTNPLGEKTKFVLDEMGRTLAKINYNADGEIIVSEGVSIYEYDTTATNGKGRLVSAQKINSSNTGVVTRYNEYGDNGNITSITKEFVNEGIVESYTSGFEYNISGMLKAITYPGAANTKIGYEYWQHTGLLKRVYEIVDINVEQNMAQVLEYDISGKIQKMQFGSNSTNVVNSSYTYDPHSKRLESIHTKSATIDAEGMEASISDIMKYSYTYYASGDIHHIMDDNNSANTYEYAYDNLSRLIKYSETQHPNGDTIEYVYSPTGSILKKKINDTEYNYGYDYNGTNDEIPHAVKSVENVLPSFDEREITYNVNSMPLKITDKSVGMVVITEFVYDSDGKRAKKKVTKVEGGIESIYETYYVNGYYEVHKTVSGGYTDTKTKKYVFAGNQRIGMMNDAGEVYYFHQDHLGSLIAISKEVNDSITEVIAHDAVYYPFGQLKGNEGQNFCSYSNYNFTGQELDHDIDLYNYDARLYDPAIGVFITPDTIVPEPSDPQSFNRYSYCLNNPISYTDPSGHSPQLFFFAANMIFTYASTDGDSQALFTTAITSAVTAGMFNGVGNATMAPGIGIGEKALAHAVAGGVSSAFEAGLTGGDMGRAFVSGGVSAGLGEYFGGNIYSKTIAGGVGSMLSGGKFGDGAKMAAAGHIFNSMLHPTVYDSLKEWGYLKNWPSDKPLEFKMLIKYAKNYHIKLVKDDVRATLLAWKEFKPYSRKTALKVMQSETAKQLASAYGFTSILGAYDANISFYDNISMIIQLGSFVDVMKEASKICDYGPQYFNEELFMKMNNGKSIDYFLYQN